ncbi:MAG: hypothetical protein V2I97_11510 [Desulfococcaceae bacterium]|jgi:RNA polymerase sigma factor (sigma-70 family)|nr:hypothetical protein [Desulfococcaceae bacterium]
MKNQSNQKDRETAERICKELLSGNHEAITELYYEYNNMFQSFARQRLYRQDPHKTREFLSDFWLGLLNGKAVCSYQGKNEASLRTFLFTILYRKIIDNNRKKEIQGITVEYIDEEKRNETESSGDVEEIIIEKEERKRKEQMFREAILIMGEKFPNDLRLIQMQINGLNYRQMAEHSFSGEKPEPEKLRQKKDAIRKQFTRERTGSLARFKVILERLNEKYKIFPSSSPMNQAKGAE